MNYRIFLTLSALILLAGFSSCVQNVTTESVLHSNGELDRVVMFTETSKDIAEKNIFGIDQSKGWKLDIVPSGTKTEKGEPEFNVKFFKRFSSIEAANREMCPDSNLNVFQIRTKLDRKFRWFYTYYEYSDTYLHFDKLDSVDQSNYFTREDYAFIERLPAEGKKIPANDEYFHNKLNERIVDDYLGTELKMQVMKAIGNAIRENTTDTSWLKKYHSILPDLIEKGMESGDKLQDGSLMKEFLKEINLPLDTAQVNADFRRAYAPFDEKLTFLQDAGASRFTHVIRLPWPIVESNADSVSGSALFWQPPTIKMYLKDYTMRATGRSLNWWAVLVSLAVLVATLYLFLRSNRV